MSQQTQAIVSDLLAAFGPVPSPIDSIYAWSVSRAAAFLGEPVSDDVQNAALSNNDTGSDELNNLAVTAANNVSDAASKIDALAQSIGTADPLDDIRRVASPSRSTIGGQGSAATGDTSTSVFDDATADSIVSKLRNLIQQVVTGQRYPQFAGVELSIAAFSDTGNISVDLSRLAGTAAQAAAQQALNPVVPFEESKIQIQFIADVPTAAMDGTTRRIVGWRKNEGASGYILRRRDCFRLGERRTTLSNADLNTERPSLIDDANAWALDFYDQVEPSSVLLHEDDALLPDSYYLYSVTAYRDRKSSDSTVFGVGYSARRIPDELRQLLADSTDPFSVLSTSVFGRSDYGWILAGINVKASFDRGDDATSVIKTAYLQAKGTDLVAASDAGSFVVPDDAGQVIAGVAASSAEFGIDQTIRDVLFYTGTMFSFGADAVLPGPGLELSGVAALEQNQIYIAVLRSMDKNSLTIDLATLAANVARAAGVQTPVENALASNLFSVLSGGALDPSDGPGMSRLMFAIKSFAAGLPVGVTPTTQVVPVPVDQSSTSVTTSGGTSTTLTRPPLGRFPTRG